MPVMGSIRLIKLSIGILWILLSGCDPKKLPPKDANSTLITPLPFGGHQTAGQPVTVSRLPASHLASLNTSINLDLAFYNRQLELVNAFALILKTLYQEHFGEDNLKVRFNKHRNQTKFVFNKRCLFSALKNSTFKAAYGAYLHDLQTAFNQFELLAQKLEHLIALTSRAKEKINLEVTKTENWLDNGLGELPIKRTLTDYTMSVAKEIGTVKEQIKFHFFNFFFLTKLLLAKERWLAENAIQPTKGGSRLGPIHKLAYSNQTFQIKILDLISQKQYLEKI